MRQSTAWREITVAAEPDIGMYVGRAAGVNGLRVLVIAPSKKWAHASAAWKARKLRFEEALTPVARSA